MISSKETIHYESNLIIAKHLLPTLISIYSNTGRTQKEIVDIAFEYAQLVISHPVTQEISKKLEEKFKGKI